MVTLTILASARTCWNVLSISSPSVSRVVGYCGSFLQCGLSLPDSSCVLWIIELVAYISCLHINCAFGSLSNRFLRSVANERKLKHLGLKLFFFGKVK